MNKSILVGIPVIYAEGSVQRCLDHIEHQADELIIIDNDSTQEVKNVIAGRKIIVNKRNIYVNPAWNQIIEYFLASNHDYVIILNSDLYVKPGTLQIIKGIDIDADKTVLVAPIVDEFGPTEHKYEEINGGVPGTFIVLSKQMCKLVYPIPSEIRLWFGDNWIYEKLKKNGYIMRILHSLQTKHEWSQSVKRLPEAAQIIEEDKIQWLKIVERL